MREKGFGVTLTALMLTAALFGAGLTYTAVAAGFLPVHVAPADLDGLTPRDEPTQVEPPTGGVAWVDDALPIPRGVVREVVEVPVAGAPGAGDPGGEVVKPRTGTQPTQPPVAKPTPTTPPAPPAPPAPKPKPTPTPTPTPSPPAPVQSPPTFSIADPTGYHAGGCPSGDHFVTSRHDVGWNGNSRVSNPGGPFTVWVEGTVVVVALCV